MNAPVINRAAFLNAATPPHWDILGQIVDEAASLAGISRADILGYSHRRDFAWPRQFAMWQARQHGLPYVTIGRFFRRDHTTVIHACRAVEARMKGQTA
jgi:chromosomal replication initiator protein